MCSVGAVRMEERGGVIGWELGANGQVNLGMSALVGAWDNLGHAFVQLGLMEGVVVWD